MVFARTPQDDTYSRVGVSLENIRKHLSETIPGLREWGISNSTISSLFLPPTLRNKKSKFYLIRAKVCKVRNDRREKVLDGHYGFSEVKIVHEHAEMSLQSFLFRSTVWIAFCWELSAKVVANG